jgi:hypothetical protein
MRLPRYAEHSFARACSAADAVPHRPDEDQNGWDYLVEFDNKSRGGLADTHPPASKAFVQIKSSIGKRLSCTVKLSNALKSAQSRWPWFVVLYSAPRGSKGPAIYAKHIWQEAIEQTLPEVRLAEKAGVPLNQKKITINFEETDRKSEDELVIWMERCIDEVKPDYGQQKAIMHSTVGFENGHAVGQFEFAVEDEETLFSNFLGLGNGLAGTKFVLTPTRFGIEDSAPSFSVENATVHIMPDPVAECEIRLRGPLSANSVSIPAKVFALREPIVAPERRRLRFSGVGIEIVWSFDGYARFEFNVNYEERLPLPDIEKLATIMMWSGTGPIDVQIWNVPNGGRAIAAKLNSDENKTRRPEWEKIIGITKTLKLLAGSTSEDSIAVSIVDLSCAASDLYFMHQIIPAPSLMLEFFPLLDFPTNTDHVLYYLWADVGDLTAYALIARPLRAIQDLTDGRKRMVLGEPRTYESWIVQRDTARAMIEGDYRRWIEMLRASGHPPLEFGDIGQVYKQGLASRDASDGTPPKGQQQRTV